MRLALVATAVGALALGGASGALGARFLILQQAGRAPAMSESWSRAPALQQQPSDWIGRTLARAVRAQSAPATLPASELVAFESTRDAEGRPFAGASTYLLHFAPGTLPPGDALWSLVARGPQNSRADADAPDAISSRATTLRRNGDGSLDIVVTAHPPDDVRANWLASPTGAFALVLRIYAPLPAVRDGDWRPPAVLRRETSA